MNLDDDIKYNKFDDEDDNTSEQHDFNWETIAEILSLHSENGSNKNATNASSFETSSDNNGSETVSDQDFMPLFERDATMDEDSECLFVPLTDLTKNDKIKSLVRQLGSKKYHEREQAQRDLIEIGIPAMPEIKKALKDKDLEIAKRAEAIWEDLYPKFLSQLPDQFKQDHGDLQKMFQELEKLSDAGKLTPNIEKKFKQFIKDIDSKQMDPQEWNDRVKHLQKQYITQLEAAGITANDMVLESDKYKKFIARPDIKNIDEQLKALHSIKDLRIDGRLSLAKLFTINNRRGDALRQLADVEDIDPSATERPLYQSIWNRLDKRPGPGDIPAQPGANPPGVVPGGGAGGIGRLVRPNA